MKLEVVVLVDEGMGILNPYYNERIDAQTKHTSEIVDIIRNTCEVYQKYPFTIVRIEEVIENIVTLFTNVDGIDMMKDGYAFFAWDESIKEEGDIEIEVEKSCVEPSPVGEKGNFVVEPGANVTIKS